MSAAEQQRAGLQKAIAARKAKNKAEAEAIFKSNGTHGDQEIGVKEFHDIVYSLGYHLSDEQVAIACSTLDVDGSGSISFEEFYTWWTKEDKFDHLQLDERQVEAVQAASAYFEYFDKDKSGMIDHEEFKALFDDLKGRGGYFDAGTTVQEGMKQVKGKFSDQENISFNDYVFWLLKKGCITHFTL